MLTVTRIYKNSDGETLRIDSIMMVPTTNGLQESFQRQTYARKLSTQKIMGPTDRVVAAIELNSTATTYETDSGNYLWAAWSSPYAKCEMTDLPKKTENA